MGMDQEVVTGISYREDFGCWWPDYDHAPEACHSKVLRRMTDVDITIGECRSRRLAVQAGGHVGHWPRRLAAKFDRVFTFEPDPYLYMCLAMNLLDTNNIIALQLALGSSCGMTKMRRHASAGSWRVDKEEGTVAVPQTTIDYILRGLPCDAIILDVEGSELDAIRGASKTIRDHRPVIHVEGLAHRETPLHQYLMKIGYDVVREIHSDTIYRRI